MKKEKWSKWGRVRWVLIYIAILMQSYVQNQEHRHRVVEKTTSSLQWSELARERPALPKFKDKLHWSLANIETERTHAVWEGNDDPILIAVIDTGIYTPKFRSLLWANSGEQGRDSSGRDRSTNGLDDDQNGFVDDVHGWNFVHGNSNIEDHHGHGSHVAGIIAQQIQTNDRVRIMVLKYYNPGASGAQNLENTLRAIRYATHMGAHIINYSGGGAEKDLREMEALKAAPQTLFVAAAGNEGRNTDKRGFYPASYPLPNILSVVAVNKDDRVLASSNYGRYSVDLLAPGEKILSVLSSGDEGHMTGTSQSTAFVSGAAALLMSKYPHLRNPPSLIRHLTSTGEESSHWKAYAHHRLNLYRTLVQRGHGLSITDLRAQNTRYIDGRPLGIEGFLPNTFGVSSP